MIQYYLMLLTICYYLSCQEVLHRLELLVTICHAFLSKEKLFSCDLLHSSLFIYIHFRIHCKREVVYVVYMKYRDRQFDFSYLSPQMKSTLFLCLLLNVITIFET